jgi:hypothetical protein
MLVAPVKYVFSFLMRDVEGWVRDGMPGRPRTRAQHDVVRQIMSIDPDLVRIEAECVFASKAFAFQMDEDAEVAEIMKLTGLRDRNAAKKLIDDDDHDTIDHLTMMHCGVPSETIALVKRCCNDGMHEPIDLLTIAVDIAETSKNHVNDVLRAIYVFDKTDNSSCAYEESIVEMRRAGFPEHLIACVFEKLRC